MSDAGDPEPESRSAAFLAALADPARPPLPQPAAIVVAHPDDETIGCGAQLSRFADVKVIHVTDGAPQDGVDARRLGFASPPDYAAARRAELETAMALVGLAPARLIALNRPDQGATADMAAVARDLTGLLADREVVLTHAYEGGHPDHDAAALAVHAACALLRRDGPAPAIVEMPLYRAGRDGMAAQSFAPGPSSSGLTVPLAWEEQQLKQAMYAAHASQHDVLLLFRVDAEHFRAAPLYDFTQPANGGHLHYERQPWGMDSARWLEHARLALAELGLGGGL